MLPHLVGELVANLGARDDPASAALGAAQLGALGAALEAAPAAACPAAGERLADAALCALGAVQALAPPPKVGDAFLRQAVTGVLGAPAPRAGAANGGDAAMEALVRRLGYRRADARAAEREVWADVVVGALGLPACAVAPPLDLLLEVAAAGGGAAAAALGATLPALLQLPTEEADLTPRGWAALMHLERAALDRVLAEAVAAAAAPGDLRRALAARPGLDAALRAVAADAALHLAARRTLHSWFAESGGLPAWWLLAELVRRALELDAGESADGALPARVQALHPRPLRAAAAALLVASPSLAALPAALDAVDAGVARLIADGGDADAAREAGWRLLLDAAPWLRLALVALPLDHAALAAPEGGGVADAAGPSAGALDIDSGGERAAAARLAAALMWPHSAPRRAALEAALALDFNVADAAVAERWVAALRRWRGLFSGKAV
jgi:hypothetical protein